MPTKNHAKSQIEKLKLKDGSFTWVNINHPNDASIEYLKRNYEFHHLDLEDCISQRQRPKIDDYEDYLFLILHIPIKPRGKQVRSSELYLFIGQDFIVTLHRGNPIIKKVFEDCKSKKKVKEEYMRKGSGYFLYMLINDLFESGLPLIDYLDKQISELEVEVFDSGKSRDRLREILLLKKDIINFRRIIMPERAIVAQLEHKNKKFLPEKLDVYFDDIVDKIEKMWNNLENLKELVDSLQETNESVISHNTNNVIKILTVFSVVMLPLTFITGFYGMNVQGLPFVGTQASILKIAGILAFVAISMISYFRYRRWI